MITCGRQARVPAAAAARSACASMVLLRPERDFACYFALLIVPLWVFHGREAFGIMGV